jgi:hypothetical protein
MDGNNNQSEIERLEAMTEMNVKKTNERGQYKISPKDDRDIILSGVIRDIYDAGYQIAVLLYKNQLVIVSQEMDFNTATVTRDMQDSQRPAAAETLEDLIDIDVILSSIEDKYYITSSVDDDRSIGTINEILREAGYRLVVEKVASEEMITLEELTGLNVESGEVGGHYYLSPPPDEPFIDPKAVDGLLSAGYDFAVRFSENMIEVSRSGSSDEKPERGG